MTHAEQFSFLAAFCGVVSAGGCVAVGFVYGYFVRQSRADLRARTHATPNPHRKDDARGAQPGEVEGPRPPAGQRIR